MSNASENIVLTLNDFILQYDIPGMVCLLEGKRKVLEEDQPLLQTLGKLLAASSKYIVFRSGNAKGADELFTVGVKSIDPNRLEIILPYTNHRKPTAGDTYSLSLDELNIASEPEIIYQTNAASVKNKKLIDRYVSGIRDKLSIKAAYLLRDTVKVLGDGKEFSPAGFAFFYTASEDPFSGGTGHTVKVCQRNNVQWINQSVWMSWVK
jgi:hypothetical protein